MHILLFTLFKKKKKTFYAISWPYGFIYIYIFTCSYFTQAINVKSFSFIICDPPVTELSYFTVVAV